jgi:hypothetical protein
MIQFDVPGRAGRCRDRFAHCAPERLGLGGLRHGAGRDDEPGSICKCEDLADRALSERRVYAHGTGYSLGRGEHAASHRKVSARRRPTGRGRRCSRRWRSSSAWTGGNFPDRTRRESVGELAFAGATLIRSEYGVYARSASLKNHPSHSASLGTSCGPRQGESLAKFHISHICNPYEPYIHIPEAAHHPPQRPILSVSI